MSNPNYTSTPLEAGAIFTGNAEEITYHGYISTQVFSDQSSAVNGLSLEFSTDGANWDVKETHTITANTAATFETQCSGTQFRVVYTNGSTNQTAFRLQCVKKKIKLAQDASQQPMQGLTLDLTQDYVFGDRTNSLTLQGQTTGADSALELYAKDGDGTDDVHLRLVAVGIPSNVSNAEYMDVEYDKATNSFLIYTQKTGTGAVRPLKIYTDGNTNQLHLGVNGNVGVGTSTPVSQLDVAGSISKKVTTVASAIYTILTTDCVIAVDYTLTGSVTLTLPACSTAWNSTDSTGIEFKIFDKDCNASLNNITINRAGSDTIIDFTAAQTSTVIGANGGTIYIQAVSATEWKVS